MDSADCLHVLQRASESHRELAQQRLRHSDAVRTEMESVRGRLKTAEEDNAHKQALISHNNHQVRPSSAGQATPASLECCPLLPVLPCGVCGSSDERYALG